MCTKGCYHCDMLCDVVRALLALHQGRICIPLNAGQNMNDFSFWTTATEDGQFFLNFVSHGEPSNVYH